MLLRSRPKGLFRRVLHLSTGKLMNWAMKSTNTYPFIVVWERHSMSNSLSSTTQFIRQPEVLVSAKPSWRPLCPSPAIWLRLPEMFGMCISPASSSLHYPRLELSRQHVVIPTGTQQRLLLALLSWEAAGGPNIHSTRWTLGHIHCSSLALSSKHWRMASTYLSYGRWISWARPLAQPTFVLCWCFVAGAFSWWPQLSPAWLGSHVQRPWNSGTFPTPHRRYTSAGWTSFYTNARSRRPPASQSSGARALFFFY